MDHFATLTEWALIGLICGATLVVIYATNTMFPVF